MTIKTRSQFDSFFKGKVTRIRKTINIDIRQKSGRLNPLVLKNKLLILISRKPIPVIGHKCNDISDVYYIVSNVICFRLGGDVFNSSGFVQDAKLKFKMFRNYTRSNLPYYAKRILVCHK